MTEPAEECDADDGDDSADERTKGDPFLTHPVGDGDNGERGDSDDGEHDGGWGRFEGPLVTTDAESGAGEAIYEDPDPVRAPLLSGLKDGDLTGKRLVMGEFGE